MASRPPPPSHLPPPRHESRTQTSPYQASTEVDQAIARRRAELRRLQAKSSGSRPLPPIAAGATKTTPGWTPQDRNTGTPIFAPSVRNTPSTAAVARRLDNSYGPPVVSCIKVYSMYRKEDEAIEWLLMVVCCLIMSNDANFVFTYL